MIASRMATLTQLSTSLGVYFRFVAERGEEGRAVNAFGFVVAHSQGDLSVDVRDSPLD